MSARKSRSVLLVFALVLLASTGLIAPTTQTYATVLPVVDDFEAGLPSGQDPNGIPVGFVTFQDPNSSVAIATTNAPPAPVPGAGDPNNVLKMDVSIVSY